MSKKQKTGCSGYIRDYTPQLLQQTIISGSLWHNQDSMESYIGSFLLWLSWYLEIWWTFVNKNTMLLQEIIFLLRLVSTRKAPAENGNGFIDPYWGLEVIGSEIPFPNHLRCNYEALFCNGEICHINGKLIWNPQKESWSNGILCHVDVLAENWSTDLQILSRSNLSTSGRFLYFKRKPKITANQQKLPRFHPITNLPISQMRFRPLHRSLKPRP